MMIVLWCALSFMLGAFIGAMLMALVQINRKN